MKRRRIFLKYYEKVNPRFLAIDFEDQLWLVKAYKREKICVNIEKQWKYCIIAFGLVHCMVDNMKEEVLYEGMYILVGVIALIAGVALGFFIARRYMMSYLKKNPPINEQMLKMMMMQMGMKPSQKKINQMMQAMNKQQGK